MFLTKITTLLFGLLLGGFDNKYCKLWGGIKAGGGVGCGVWVVDSGCSKVSI